LTWRGRMLSVKRHTGRRRFAIRRARRYQSLRKLTITDRVAGSSSRSCRLRTARLYEALALRGEPRDASLRRPRRRHRCRLRRIAV
jgi:hypothetical protein